MIETLSRVPDLLFTLYWKLYELNRRNLINRSVPINLGNRMDESFSEVIEETGRYQPLDSDDPDYYLTDDDF